MDIVGLLVAADRAHVCIKTFTDLETVFFQRISFPLGQRLHDFSHAAVLLENIKINRALNTVQIVVQSGSGVDKKRRGNAKQVQSLRKHALEKIFDCLNTYLCIVQIQRGMVILGNHRVFHTHLPCRLRSGLLNRFCIDKNGERINDLCGAQEEDAPGRQPCSCACFCTDVYS